MRVTINVRTKVTKVTKVGKSSLLINVYRNFNHYTNQVLLS